METPSVSQSAKVIAVNISEKTGEKKHDVGKAYLVAGHGITNDAHSGNWHRQISLLSLSSFKKMEAMGVKVSFGDFAENLTVDGINVVDLPVGSCIKIGDTLLRVTQIGKKCHNSGCAIKRQAGTCIMPVEGIFAEVLESGWIEVGDTIEILETGNNCLKTS